jgi:hypothetical protein
MTVSSAISMYAKRAANARVKAVIAPAFIKAVVTRLHTPYVFWPSGEQRERK